MVVIFQRMLTCAMSQGGRVSEWGGVQLWEGGKVLRRLREGGTGEGLNWKAQRKGRQERQREEEKIEIEEIRGLCWRRRKAGAAADLSSAVCTLLGAGQVEAPQGLDHGTEPSRGDPSGPTTTQQWRWVSGLTCALCVCFTVGNSSIATYTAWNQLTLLLLFNGWTSREEIRAEDCIINFAQSYLSLPSPLHFHHQKEC